MRVCGTVAALLVGLAMCVHAQAVPVPEVPLPATGVDFSGVDQFWKIVDVLSADVEPSEAQWHALLTTPGYRLAQSAIGEVVREEFEVAFRPSRRALFDSLASRNNDRAFGLRHLARAVSLRSQLVVFRDSLGRLSPVPEATRMAARFLPPSATSVGDPPLVAFALFRADGYSLGGGVVVDLLQAYESNVTLFLAHEFHHTYLGRANNQAITAPASPADQGLRAALWALRNEGIADLIDKPYPFASSNPALATYVARYNSEYVRTPATVHALDSLLADVSDDSTRMAAAGQRARALLWSSGHANGAYMAREIYETFGVDSLFPAITSPAAFLRTYAAAEKVRGNGSPFSNKALSTITLLERRYWAQSP